MSGFVIIPVDQPPIAVEPADDGCVTITVDGRATTLNVDLTRQLIAAIVRAGVRA